MIRTNLPPERVEDEKAEKDSAACWSKDAQAQGLLVEAGGETFVFPYVHLAFGKLRREENRDVFELTFSNHRVRIRGKHLRELAIAMQKLVVEWIRPVPSRYEPLAAKRGVFIETIEVEEIAASQ